MENRKKLATGGAQDEDKQNTTQNVIYPNKYKSYK